MKQFQAMVLSVLGVVTMTFAQAAQEGSGETDGYVLVWQDLFDADELNPLRWDIEVNGSGGGNNELQYYTDRADNVRLGDDGQGNHCLILTARRESYLGKSFTSGRVNTKNRIAFTHGKIEAAIKFPSTANGLWPAFWMMGNDYDDVGWPKSGEIDIVEMGNSNGISNGVQDRYFNGACHWGQGWPAASYAKDTTKAYSLQDGEFHLFTLIWDDEAVAMYVDLDRMNPQTPYFKMTIPQDDPDNVWSPGNYFHKDNFILFNLAVGGDFTGIHSADGITALNDDNGQQAAMYVDYVRIYQKGVLGERTDFLDPGDPRQEAAAIDDIADAVPAISYDGARITSAAPMLSLYSLSGTRMAASTTGVIDTCGLAPGVYLAANYAMTRKILITHE